VKFRETLAGAVPEVVDGVVVVVTGVPVIIVPSGLIRVILYWGLTAVVPVVDAFAPAAAVTGVRVT